MIAFLFSIVYNVQSIRTWLSLGSEGSAAGGGFSDPSEWPGSVGNAAAPSARRTPGTATGRALALELYYRYNFIFPDVAQFGRALALGARCRRFESCHPDQKNRLVSTSRFFN